MLVDTGSDRTIVSAGVVRGVKLDAENKVPMLCVHGNVCSYPTAQVEMVSGHVGREPGWQWPPTFLLQFSWDGKPTQR